MHLAAYHRHALTGHMLGTSTVLTRKADGGWLTLCFDEDRSVATPRDAPVMGREGGIVPASPPPRLPSSRTARSESQNDGRHEAALDTPAATGAPGAPGD